MSPLPDPRILPCGDSALSVDFGNLISLPINRRVHALDAALTATALSGVIEAVPSYRALTVYFDPLAIAYDDLEAELWGLIRQTAGAADRSPRRWRVPVVFGGPWGEDLADCANLLGLSEAGYVEAFVAETFQVMMIGFMPGFAYLAGLPEAMARPRRAVPRPRIPAGSVSIGGAQAAIGSVAGPSGWHLLGRTPALPFLPGRDPLFLFDAGDEIRFEPVPAEDWDRLAEAARQGAPVIRAEEAGQ